ncbi:MAG TPA: sigma-70 family RNA polymerase sigma factor [Thermomicrobiaceae bacterium]|nr:sigma-70 family RNA polymerase sigma factor [Thermomicrobiaceae bacterium]
MHESDWLAERFEGYRGRLTAVAYRMLGSPSEAEDAVQETWLRLSRSDVDAVENLGSWLTTVVSRVCLNMLQARRSRPELPAGARVPEPVAGSALEADPEREALLADSIGLALLVVLDTLSPAERVAFVLHDMFAVPFEDIARIVGRSTPATRQLASRARRRVQGQGTDRDADGLRHDRLVDAFLAAARDGNFDALLAVLDPDIALRADETAVKLGAPPEIHGAHDAARFLSIARGATPALIEGQACAVWLVQGRPRVVYRFTTGDRIVAVDLIADPERLRAMDLIVLGRA